MINRTVQTLDTELSRRLPAVERSLRDMKSQQFMGADNLAVNRTSGPNASVTLAAGDSHYYEVQFTGFAAGGANTYYISEFGFDIYLTNDADLTYLWPVGANVTGDLQLLEVYHFYSGDLSSETTTGMKNYTVRIKNIGVSSKTVYFHARLLYFTTTLAGG